MNQPNPQDYWRKCTSCKSQIKLGQKYWVCSVSTCNRVRTNLVFCSVGCFDAHVPVLNHRDAGAIEKLAPMTMDLEQEKHQPAQQAPSRRIITQAPSFTPPQTVSANSTDHVKREILVVVSKAKDYVREKSGMNTSDAVMEILSNKIRQHLDAAIQKAIKDGRKTVLDRDF